MKNLSDKTLHELLLERTLIECDIFETAEEVVRFDGTERISLEKLRESVYARRWINVEVERRLRKMESSL
jgi:hypothetical protein